MKAYSEVIQGLPGYWSDSGKFYPIIAGGSDAMTSAAAMISGSGEGGEGTDNSGAGSQDGLGSQESSGNSFAREILDSLDVSDKSERAVLEKYLSGIDSQVNGRFQKIHDQYAPFKDMDAEQVQNAMGIMQLIEHNPQHVIEIISEALGEGDEGELGGETGEEPGTEKEGEYGLDPEFVSRFTRVEELLENIAQIVVDQQNSSQEAQEDAELEEELESLKEEYGDFDEEWVLSYAAGAEIDLEDAVKSFQGLAQKLSGQNGNSAPPAPGPMLSGNSSPPNELINPTEMSSKDTKSLVAQLLSAAQAEE